MTRPNHYAQIDRMVEKLNLKVGEAQTIVLPKSKCDCCGGFFEDQEGSTVTAFYPTYSVTEWWCDGCQKLHPEVIRG